ncbi:SRPBCC domain-containing protein [Phenylobacterium montanum]|uniref:SRPBCC domain-containing protein n=1 Tax=Phenylobacterium montanum TaxID=2823693 RepID=A0A975FWC7_9CAUL|nr:SRPBCC domain-containing protein [Caulobacter sp. S6]QUD86346.1 SRPBCC domain-containing protein [Caulobacter sp. S6]
MVMPLPSAFRRRDGAAEFELVRHLRQPVDKVWAALTTPQRLAAWMGVEWLSGDAPLKRGADFSYRFLNSDLESRGKVLRLEPPHVLEHSWFENVAPGTVIRWAVEPDGDGCRLTLTHRFGQVDDAPRTAAGWTSILEQLAVALEEPGAVLPAGMDDWRRLRDTYAAALPPEATRDGRRLEVGGLPALRFERRIRRPAQAVWEALTTPEGIARWMQAEAIVEPRVGGCYRLAFHDFDHVMEGAVTAWDPPRAFEYTWTEAQAGGDSLVRVTLEPDGEGCRLVLLHTLKAGGEMADFASGWHWHLDCLDDAAEGVASRFDRARWEVLRAAYGMTL